jgi:hypothetical protein
VAASADLQIGYISKSGLNAVLMDGLVYRFDIVLDGAAIITGQRDCNTGQVFIRLQGEGEAMLMDA